MAKLEFYIGGAYAHIAVVDADAVPREKEYINIRGETYQVSHVTWAVDQADSIRERQLRACVVLQESKTDEQA